MRLVNPSDTGGPTRDGEGVDRRRRTLEVKDRVRRRLALPAEATVVVQELSCREPGCPPVETVLAVLRPGTPTRRTTVHRPLLNLTSRDIDEALPALPSDIANPDITNTYTAVTPTEGPVL